MRPEIDELRDLEYRITHLKNPDQKLLDNVRKLICDRSAANPSTKESRPASSGATPEKQRRLI